MSEFPGTCPAYLPHAVPAFSLIIRVDRKNDLLSLIIPLHIQPYLWIRGAYVIFNEFQVLIVLYFARSKPKNRRNYVPILAVNSAGDWKEP